MKKTEQERLEYLEAELKNASAATDSQLRELAQDLGEISIVYKPQGLPDRCLVVLMAGSKLVEAETLADAVRKLAADL